MVVPKRAARCLADVNLCSQCSWRTLRSLALGSLIFLLHHRPAALQYGTSSKMLVEFCVFTHKHTTKMDKSRSRREKIICCYIFASLKSWMTCWILCRICFDLCGNVLFRGKVWFFCRPGCRWFSSASTVFCGVTACGQWKIANV